MRKPWGAPEVPFVLGEGTGDFLLPRFELGGGWQRWQGLWEGGSTVYHAVPAAGSAGFKGTLIIFRNMERD